MDISVSSITVTLLSAALAHVLYKAVLFLRYRHQIDAIPGPKVSSWLVGNLDLIGESRVDFLKEMVREYGNVFRVWIGPFKPMVVVADPSALKRVLMSNMTNYSITNRTSLGTIIGDGLLRSKGDFWRRQRRLMQPAFHAKWIAMYQEEVVSATTILMKKWGDALNAKDKDPSEASDVDPTVDFMLLTLDVIGKTAFGTDLKALDSVSPSPIVKGFLSLLQLECPPPGEARVKLQKHLFLVELYEVYTKVMAFINRKGIARLKEVLMSLDDHTYGIIRERRKALSEDPDNQPDDLFGRLLSSEDEEGQRLTDKQLRDEAMTILVAGHDTTSVLLSWTLYFLAQHPDVEEKVLDEVDEVLQGKVPEASKLGELTYLTAVLQETLRIFPSVPFAGRMCLEADVIGKHNIPANTYVAISAPVVNTNPNLWEKPNEFFPERFMDPSHDRFAYIPFGAGPRDCLGKGFAMMEAKTVLAMVLQKFRFKTPSGLLESVHKHDGIITRPFGLSMQVVRR